MKSAHNECGILASSDGWANSEEESIFESPLITAACRSCARLFVLRRIKTNILIMQKKGGKTRLGGGRQLAALTEGEHV